MKATEQRIEHLRTTITHVEPRAALRMHDQGAIIVDVREKEEWDLGSPKGALRIRRSFLELCVESDIPDLQRQILLICAAGPRALFAADDLLRLGYCNVACIDGGFRRWSNEGLPVELPARVE